MSEWGPWADHDGNGCPCVGQYVQVIYGDDYEEFGIAGENGGHSWDWKLKVIEMRIVRYRIRKPRGVSILENLISDLPAPVRKVDA